MRRRITSAAAVAALLVLLGAPSVQASLTAWYPSPHEPNLDQILERLYGMGNLERVDDAGDQYWSNWAGQAWARARYAGQEPTFGFLPNGSGGSFNPLFTVTGGGENPAFTPSSPVLFPASATGDPFRFALASGGHLWSSRTAGNADGLDHMLSFKIVGSDEAHDNRAILGNYVFAWEDLLGDLCSSSSDRDFQDMIVEVHGVDPWDPEPPEVPEPASLLLLTLGGLGGLAGRLRRRGGRN